jgi:hypothetical protein
MAEAFAEHFHGHIHGRIDGELRFARGTGRETYLW